MRGVEVVVFVVVGKLAQGAARAARGQGSIVVQYIYQQRMSTCEQSDGHTDDQSGIVRITKTSHGITKTKVGPESTKHETLKKDEKTYKVIEEKGG